MKHLRSQALKAHHLHQKNITGDELAARMKCAWEIAQNLVDAGRLIEAAEARRLIKSEREVLKVICRVIARNVLSIGNDRAKTNAVDFAAGRRGGWCGKALPGLIASGLVEMPIAGRVALTPAGWAFAWATGLIKPTWKVPT